MTLERTRLALLIDPAPADLDQLTDTERERLNIEHHDDGSVEMVVAITHPDRLRTELEAPAYGLSDISSTPFHFMTMWAWAALIRLRVIPSTTPFGEFKNTLIEFEDVDQKGAPPGVRLPGVPVPPTMPGATNSSSPSPSTGPESTGPTPNGPSLAVTPTG